MLTNINPLAALNARLNRIGNPQSLVQLQDLPSDDSSILENLAQGGLSALQWLGESLDKTFGARTLRGLLGGEGPAALAHLLPFSDTLGLTDKRGILGSDLLASKEDVPSGRGLLEQAGVLDQKTEPGFDFGDILGFGTEVLLDPSLGLSLGGRALSTSGKLAEAAGVMPGALHEGTQLVRGAREARLGTNLDTILKATPEARAPLETALAGHGISEPIAQAKKLDELLASGEPLGSLAKFWGMPVGTGQTAQTLAKMMDQAGEAIRYSPPGRLAAGLFSNPSREMLTKEGQLVRQASTAATTRASEKAGEDMMPIIRAFEAAGLGGDDQIRAIRDMVEGLAPVPAELQGHMDTLRGMLKDMPEQSRDLGLNLTEWESKHPDVQYAPRQAAASSGTATGGKLFSTNDPFAQARIESLDVPGGTNQINDISIDPFVSGPAREAIKDSEPVANRIIAAAQANKRINPDFRKALAGDDVAESAVKRLASAQRKHDRVLQGFTAKTSTQAELVAAKKELINARDAITHEVSARHIREEHLGFDEKAWNSTEKELKQAVKDLKKTPDDPAILAEIDSLHQELAPMRQTVAQSRKLSQYMAGLDPSHAAEAKPLFPNHPLVDTYNRVRAFQRSTEAAKGAYDFLGQYATKEGTELNSVRIKDILPEMGLKYNTKVGDAEQFTGALARMAEQKGVRPDEILDFRIPKELAGDVTRMLKTFQSPDTIKQVLGITDAITQGFKKWVTLPWPGFHFRNKATGVASDVIAGVKPTTILSNHQQLMKLLAGETVEGLSKAAPIFKGMTDAEATQALANMLSTHGLYHGGQVAQDIAQRMGESVSLSSILPGVEPNTIGSALKAGLPGKGTGLGRFAIHPGESGMQLGHLVEDSNRGATFLGLLKQGWNEATAAAKSKAVHGDYSQMTQFEKAVMKRLVPFYAFNRKVLPEFVSSMMHNPGGSIAQAIRFENDLRQESGFVPDYVSKGLAVPLGESAPGTTKFLTDSGILPIENLNDLLQFGVSPLDTARKTGEALIGQSNPLLKGPLELLTGRQFYTDRDLRDLKTHLGLPPLVEQVVMNSPAARGVSTLSKLFDQRKGAVEKGLNVLTGLRTSDVDMDKARDIAAKESIEGIMRGQSGARMLPGRLYVDQQSLALMSDEQRKMMQLYSGINKRAQAKAKEHRLEKAQLDASATGY